MSPPTKFLAILGTVPSNAGNANPIASSLCVWLLLRIAWGMEIASPQICFATARQLPVAVKKNTFMCYISLLLVLTLLDM